MVTRYTRKSLTWVDLTSPTGVEVRALLEEFDIHPIIADELLSPSTKQKAEVRGSHLYMVMHVPTFRDGRIGTTQEIDFIAGKNVLITTRYQSVDRLHSFAKEFERDSMLGHSSTGPLGSHLLFHMIEWLYRDMAEELETVRGVLERIEERIFVGKEKEMVFELSNASRALLDFGRALLPHRELLGSLELVGGRLWGADFAFYARTLQGHQTKLTTQLEQLRDLLTELRGTNDSLLTTKQNETMRVLTIMALLTFPLSLFVAIFDIDADYNPIVGLPYDFWIVVGIVVLAALLMLWYFRHKKWL